MKIAVYGTGKIGELVWNVVKKRRRPCLKIVYFVRTQKDRDSFHGVELRSVKDISFQDFDYLVIATELYADEMIAQLREVYGDFGEYQDKIIPFDDFLVFPWDEGDESQPYRSYKVFTEEEELVFIAKSEDQVISREMYCSGKCFSSETIDAFFELTQKYYTGCSKSFSTMSKYTPQKRTGYFLDIGANIGTTSIYVEKRFPKSLKIIGFEPGQSNYDLFKVNCMLNHTQNIKAEFFGLSDNNERKNYHYVDKNPGASTIICGNSPTASTETVELKRLDDYLLEHHIQPNEIDYIWIDAEGYESKIISGAMHTLACKKIPLLHEFNPGIYSQQNMLESYLENMEKIYGHFISLGNNLAEMGIVYPISELKSYAVGMKAPHVDMFFF